MLLQEIKLKNIRSYSEETIRFDQGLTLLSGDIGSGKSSLLLAIEFALFGSSRPDLPAEALLKKGAMNGSVELTFTLDNDAEKKEIIIKRNLKKEKDSIKQTSGFLIINNLKKELTPVELKAEVISLLGYPEDALTKNKNFLFRYTVYCPQEEMKLILQEDSEIRSDTLRKIFNIDKYKIIRDNLQNYFRTLRAEIEHLKEKTAPLEPKKEQLGKLNLLRDTLTVEISHIQHKLTLVQEKSTKQKQELEVLEREQKLFIEIKQKLHSYSIMLKEKEEHLQQLKNKQEILELNISKLSSRLLSSELSGEELQLQLKKAEEEKNRLVALRLTIQENIRNVQREIEQSRNDVELLEKDVSSEIENEQTIKKLELELSEREKIEENKRQLDELLDKTNEIISKNQAILTQSEEQWKKIYSLEICPTCFQKVTIDYKDKVREKEFEHIKKAENLLIESTNKKNMILEQRKSIEVKIKELSSREKVLIKLKTELFLTQEKKKKLLQLKERMHQQVIENNMLLKKNSEIKQEDIEALSQSIDDKKAKIQLVFQIEQLKKQGSEYKEDIRSTDELANTITRERKETEILLASKMDLSETIPKKKEEYYAIFNEEKGILVDLAGKKSDWKNLENSYNVLSQDIELLKEEKGKLTYKQEVLNWLEEYFLNLTYSIERQIMLNIHYLFNKFFQEWFSILIEDEQMISRIDDSFSPIIELNGYEMPFFNLSGGEKTSASLAYRLALNKVVNEIIHNIKTKDLLILDEPTDGFSSEQLDKVREVLERLRLRQIIIVSHESKIESFVENVIKIRKDENASKVFLIE